MINERMQKRAKAIVDSWAQDDELGNDLLSFASDLDRTRRR